MTETIKEAARRFAAPMMVKGFKPEGLYQYTTADGTMTHARMRLKNPATGDKYIRPLWLNGTAWELREPDYPDGKPLYRLHELAAQPAAPCWFVEGENCADALAKLGLLTTTAGGATSDEGADFAPLAGRTMTIWPDNDAPGIEHAERVAVTLRAIGCKVESIDAAALGLPEGGDCVDWLKANPGATAVDLAELPRALAAVAPISIKNDSAEVIYCKISDIEAQPIRWLWPGRIARGKVSIIAGHPGLGKSQITTSLAAVVTQGGRWPVDRTPCERGSVLLLSAEDDVADTIRPRLEAAGADVERVHIVQAIRNGFNSAGDEMQRPFNLREDIRRLQAVLVEIGDVALIVIDPISAYLGGTDSHNNADVRTLLAPLSEMAARTGAAVVAVSHLNKGGAGSGGDALLRVTGSLAFVAAARSAYIVAKDPENDRRRLFMPAKNNVAADMGGLAFGIEGCSIGRGIETSRIAWEAEPVTGVSADELLRVPSDPEERSALEDAKDWLRGMLADGPVLSKQIMSEGKEAGHPERTLFRARKVLNIEAVKEGVKGPWMLRLPPKAAKSPQGCHVSMAGSVGSLGSLGDEFMPEQPTTKAAGAPAQAGESDSELL